MKCLQVLLFNTNPSTKHQPTALIYPIDLTIAQSAGAVEYTDCASAEGYDPTNECPADETKQYNGEGPVMLGPWGMWCTPSLPLRPGPLWLGVVAHDRALSMG